MSAEDNIKTIQAMYEAFGRGDVVAIQDACTDDVDWSAEAASTSAPWYGGKYGKAGVAAFFAAFAGAADIVEFTPLTYASNDTEVLTVIRSVITHRATGKTTSMDLHHQFGFRDGKVAYYRGTEDTEQVAAAQQ